MISATPRTQDGLVGRAALAATLLNAAALFPALALFFSPGGGPYNSGSLRAALIGVLAAAVVVVIGGAVWASSERRFGVFAVAVLVTLTFLIVEVGWLLALMWSSN